MNLNNRKEISIPYIFLSLRSNFLPTDVIVSAITSTTTSFTESHASPAYSFTVSHIPFSAVLAIFTVFTSSLASRYNEYFFLLAIYRQYAPLFLKYCISFLQTPVLPDQVICRKLCRPQLPSAQRFFLTPHRSVIMMPEWNTIFIICWFYFICLAYAENNRAVFYIWQQYFFINIL